MSIFPNRTDQQIEAVKAVALLADATRTRPPKGAVGIWYWMQNREPQSRVKMFKTLEEFIDKYRAAGARVVQIGDVRIEWPE